MDDLDSIIRILGKVGYTEDRFYIHVDGALFGLMMPFVKKVSSNCPDEQFLSCWLSIYFCRTLSILDILFWNVKHVGYALVRWFEMRLVPDMCSVS